VHSHDVKAICVVGAMISMLSTFVDVLSV